MRPLDASDRLGIRLRYHRIRAGLSLREFAQRANYNHSMVSRVERGLMPAPAALLNAYEDIVGVIINSEHVVRRQVVDLKVGVSTAPDGLRWVRFAWMGETLDVPFRPLVYVALMGRLPPLFETTYDGDGAADLDSSHLSAVNEAGFRRRSFIERSGIAGCRIYEASHRLIPPDRYFNEQWTFRLPAHCVELAFAIPRDIVIRNASIECWSTALGGCRVQLGPATSLSNAPADWDLSSIFEVEPDDPLVCLRGTDAYQISHLNVLKWQEWNLISTVPDEDKAANFLHQPIVRTVKVAATGEEWIEVESNVWRNLSGDQRTGSEI